jgi:hypothetical protein
MPQLNCTSAGWHIGASASGFTMVLNEYSFGDSVPRATPIEVIQGY